MNFRLIIRHDAAGRRRFFQCKGTLIRRITADAFDALLTVPAFSGLVVE